MTGDRVVYGRRADRTLRCVPDFADDPTTELERKARALSWTALTESVTYCILLYVTCAPWSNAATSNAIHGMIWLTFCSMVLMITKEMGWTWKYSIAVIVLGPIGGVMVWERIRREGVPGAHHAASA